MKGPFMGSAAKCSRFGDRVTASLRITIQPDLGPVVWRRRQVSKSSADLGARKDIGQPSCLAALSRTSSAIRSPSVKFRPFPFRARRCGTCLPHTRRVGSVKPVAALTCPWVSFIALLPDRLSRTKVRESSLRRGCDRCKFAQRDDRWGTE